VADAQTAACWACTRRAHGLELIAEAVLAMAFNASSEDIAQRRHAHPRCPKRRAKAALAVEGRALNIYQAFSNARHCTSGAVAEQLHRIRKRLRKSR